MRSSTLGIVVVFLVVIIGCAVYFQDNVQDTTVMNGGGLFTTDDSPSIRTITIVKMHECITPVYFQSGCGSRTIYYVMDTDGCVYRIFFDVPNIRVPERNYCLDRIIWMNFEVNGTYTVKINENGEILDIVSSP